MAGGLKDLDLNFPQDNGKPLEEQVIEIRDYLYQLLGNIQYILKNLGVTNFNETELENIGTEITEPITASISDIEGNVAELAFTAGGLVVSVADLENRNTITVDANGVIFDKDGNQTTIAGGNIEADSTIRGPRIISYNAATDIGVMLKYGRVNLGFDVDEDTFLSKGYLEFDGSDLQMMGIPGYKVMVDSPSGVIIGGNSGTGNNIRLGNDSENSNLYLKGNIFLNGNQTLEDYILSLIP